MASDCPRRSPAPVPNRCWIGRAAPSRPAFPVFGTLDRLVYPNYEPLVSLGAVAAVTDRIGLLTGVLLLPYRQNAALVAKQAATAFAADYAEQLVAATAKGEDEISERVRQFAEAGADELILFPTSPEPDQVDLLAGAVL